MHIWGLQGHETKAETSEKTVMLVLEEKLSSELKAVEIVKRINLRGI